MKGSVNEQDVKRILSGLVAPGDFHDVVGKVSALVDRAQQFARQKVMAELAMFARRFRERPDDMPEVDPLGHRETDTLCDFWLAYYVGKDGRCVLCLNGGLIYPGDNDAPVLCICPIGREMRGDVIDCAQRVRDLETLLNPEVILFEQVTAADVSRGEVLMSDERGAKQFKVVQVEVDLQDESITMHGSENGRDTSLHFTREDVVLQRL